MSKHICPRCGYKFEDSDYDPLIEDNWSYFDVTDGSFSAICDNCHQEFTKGYTRQGILERGASGCWIRPILREYICSECAKKWNYVF